MRLIALLASMTIALQASAQAEVWIGSNLGTKDLATFATDPQKWSDIFGVTKAFTFYSQQINSSDPSECPQCEDNIFPKLQQRGVFQKLVDSGLRINVETGAVKDWDCDGTKNIEVAFKVLDRFKSMDIPVSHFSMDEPFMAGEVWCKQPAAYTAAKVADWMAAVRQHWERVFPNTPVSLGLLEPYPRHEMASIINFIKMLIAKGQKPEFFHLDINKNEMAGKKYGENKIKQDLHLLAKYLESQNIPWGNFFASYTGDTPAKYRLDFLDTVKKMKRWYGTADHLVFQSWEETMEDGMKVNRRPDNIPENNAYSLTGLVRQALPILGAGKTTGSKISH